MNNTQNWWVRRCSTNRKLVEATMYHKQKVGGGDDVRQTQTYHKQEIGESN